MVYRLRKSVYRRKQLPTNNLDSTSVSDSADYVTFCESAVADDEVFASFRSNPRYTGIVETVSRTQAESYISQVQASGWQFAQKGMDLLHDDVVGGPVRSQFGGAGLLSHTGARYVHQMMEIDRLVGVPDNASICEIGGGYGGLARYFLSVFTSSTYEIFDLEPALELAQKFLRQSNIDLSRVAFSTIDQISFKNFDLVVSAYGFSELRRDLQARYFDGVINPSRSGVLIYNHISDRRLKSMTAMEVVSRLGPRAKFHPELPLTHPLNIVVAWSGVA